MVLRLAGEAVDGSFFKELLKKEAVEKVCLQRTKQGSTNSVSQPVVNLLSNRAKSGAVEKVQVKKPAHPSCHLRLKQSGLNMNFHIQRLNNQSHPEDGFEASSSQKRHRKDTGPPMVLFILDRKAWVE